jgi:hypothetical protein
MRGGTKADPVSRRLMIQALIPSYTYTYTYSYTYSYSYSTLETDEYVYDVYVYERTDSSS